MPLRAIRNSHGWSAETNFEGSELLCVGDLPTIRTQIAGEALYVFHYSNALLRDGIGWTKEEGEKSPSLRQSAICWTTCFSNSKRELQDQDVYVSGEFGNQVWLYIAILCENIDFLSDGYSPDRTWMAGEAKFYVYSNYQIEPELRQRGWLAPQFYVVRQLGLAL